MMGDDEPLKFAADPMDVLKFATTLVDEARKRDREAPPSAGEVRNWQLSLWASIEGAPWVLTAQLKSVFSSGDDWKLLGQLIGAIGYATGTEKDLKPIVPLDEAHPNAMLWWIWHSDGREVNDEASQKIIESVRVMTPRDPRWEGARS